MYNISIGYFQKQGPVLALKIRPNLLLADLSKKKNVSWHACSRSGNRDFHFLIKENIQGDVPEYADKFSGLFKRDRNTAARVN